MDEENFYYKADAITRQGKSQTFWLSQRDFARLKELKRLMRMSYSDILRYLINNEFLNLQCQPPKISTI